MSQPDAKDHDPTLKYPFRCQVLRLLFFKQASVTLTVLDAWWKTTGPYHLTGEWEEHLVKPIDVQSGDFPVKLDYSRA